MKLQILFLFSSVCCNRAISKRAAGIGLSEIRGDPNIRLTSMLKLCLSHYRVSDRRGRIGPRESVNNTSEHAWSQRL